VLILPTPTSCRRLPRTPTSSLAIRPPSGTGVRLRLISYVCAPGEHVRMEILSSSWRSGSAGRRLPTFANAPLAITYLCAGEQSSPGDQQVMLAPCPPGDQPITYLCPGEHVGVNIMAAPSSDQRGCPPSVHLARSRTCASASMSSGCSFRQPGCSPPVHLVITWAPATRRSLW
jgi:hypothetical protein